MMKKILSFFLAMMMLTSVAFAADFTDLASTHWAYSYVDELVANGVINGYEDGSYRPDANVTRAEVAKLISVQFGASEEKTYTDVAENQWYYDYVTVSGSYFITGDEFYPGNQATREEVAYAIYVAKNIKASSASASFTDMDSIDSKYQAAVAAVAENGIINGYPDGSFGPKKNITRAEIAAVLSRAINVNTSQDRYTSVLNQAKLLDRYYDDNETISYGDLASATLRMYNNEYELMYYNLGDVKGKRPFTHEDSLSFWLIGRDVLGEDIVTEEIIDTPISVGEAIDVYTHYSQLHDYNKRTIDKTVLLQGVDRDSALTYVDFAQLVTEVDEQIPTLIKVVVNGGQSAAQIGTEIRKDLESYPSNSTKYQAILEEIPNAIYETPYQISDSSLTGTYDFAREMKRFLLTPLNEFCQIAEYNGAKIQLHYYPSLVQGKSNVYVMRVKLEVLSAESGLNINDVCLTELTRPIKAGDSFFCDITTNEKVGSADMNGGKLTIDAIYE